MNKILSFKERVRVLVTIISGSILITGTVLCGAMAFAAFGFLTSGYPLTEDALWLVWGCGLFFWAIGLLPVRQYLNAEIAVAGIFTFGATGFWTFMSSMIQEQNPYYFTIGMPIIIGLILISTFLTFAVKFVGFNDDALLDETTEAEQTAPEPA